MKGVLAWWGRNPVAGNLLMIAFLVLGLASFFQMEKEFWPAGRGDSVQINAVWPGASPEDMESQVTVRIEEATASLDGISWVRSRSGEGYSWVNLTASSSVDIDALTAEARSLVEFNQRPTRGHGATSRHALSWPQLVNHHRRPR